jgi:DNA-binding IclR family transcriptional regulator
MSSFQSLDRAIDILFVFTKADPRLTADEISQKTNLPRGSIYRYINALMENGLIERNIDKNKFQLGYKLLYFQSVIHHNNVLEDIAYPYMQKIHEITSETVQLTLFRNGQAIPIESIESTASVRVAPPIGLLVALHAGANNKAILAFRPEDEINRQLSQPLEQFTESTITDPVLLKEALAKIRKEGYAWSHEEMHYGAWGISAPIIDQNGISIASLGVSGPTFRMTDELKENTKNLVINASISISEKILFHKSSPV